MAQTVQIPDFLNWSICKDIISIVSEMGGEARFVGGAVRNHLLRKPVHDVDMAVNRPIKLVANALQQRGLAVYETGIAHGTITVRQEQTSIELTQTRIDVQTDGRHALVEPIDDWVEDAKRRDFTINAIYMDRSGALFDPLNGMTDLEQGILRFIGNPEMRIQEDYLRMMRGFRFVSEYPELDFCADGIDAIKQNLDGLEQLSGERVTTEWMRLLSGQGWRQALDLASKAGLLQTVLGFQTNTDLTPPYGGRLSPLGRFAWLLGAGADLPAWGTFSRADTDLLHLYLDKLDERTAHALLSGAEWQQEAYHLGATAYQRLLLWLLWDGDEAESSRLSQIATFQPPTFPLRGADLITIGMVPGVALGQVLSELETKWVCSDFQLSKDALIVHATELIEAYLGQS